MDAVMTRRQSTGNDFESRFFDLLMDRMDKQDSKLEEIHSQTKRTNGRVTKLEGKVSVLEEAAEPSPKTIRETPLYKDPQVLKIVSYVALGLLLLIAAVTNYDITSLL